MADCIEHDNEDEDCGDRYISVLSSAGGWVMVALLTYCLKYQAGQDDQEQEGEKTERHRDSNGNLN